MTILWVYTGAIGFIGLTSSLGFTMYWLALTEYFHCIPANCQALTEYFHCIPANYQGDWKCISVLKSDGSSLIPPPVAAVRTTHLLTPGHGGLGSGYGAGLQKEPQNWYANGPFSSGGQKWALTGVIHGNMHVIVFSCTHLQKNMYVSMYNFSI